MPAVSAVWGADWNQDVAVLVTGSDTAFAQAVGSPELLEDVSAAAVTDGVDPVSTARTGSGWCWLRPPSPT